MRIGNYLRTGVVSATALISAACNQKAEVPLHQIMHLPPQMEMNARALIASNDLSVIRDKSYEFIKHDMIRIPKEKIDNIRYFLALNDINAYRCRIGGQAQRGPYLGITTPYRRADEWYSIFGTTAEVDRYIDCKAVFKNIFYENSYGNFIAVDYYGKPNPELH